MRFYHHMIICCQELNLFELTVFMFSCQTDHYTVLAVKKSYQSTVLSFHCTLSLAKFSSRWQGSNSCTLMSTCTCKYICANFKLTNMSELIYWLISVMTTTATTGWDDRPTPQPNPYPYTVLEPIYILTWRRKAQKNACCASSPQLSINLNGKTLTMALFMVKHILSWGAMKHLQKSLDIFRYVRSIFKNPGKNLILVIWI